MSRPISYTSSATVSIISFSGMNNYVTTGTSYPPSNGIQSSANTSSYAMFSATSTSSGYAYYSFGEISIPSNATINSVSCTVRARTSNASSGTTAYQLMAGSTAKGSARNVTSTTVSAYTLTTGTWTADEINNGVSLRITLRRQSSQRAYSTRFYGATLTVNYTVNGIMYEVTAVSTYTGATVSPSEQEAMNGESVSVKINTDDINTIIVEDNGVDVTENLQYVVPQGGNFSFTGVPSSFDSTNSTVAGTNTTNGCDSETTTTTATFSPSTAGGSVTSIYYNFPQCNIPPEAIITSITCRYRASWPGGNGTNNAGTTYFSSRKAYLCCGTEKRGNGLTITNTTNSQSTIDTITDVGTWEIEDLNNVKLLLEGVHQTGNTQSVTATFWGATLTVNYTIPSEPYYEYELSNINDDHEIVISESIYIPPEEDPEIEYYSLTISSINASTNPGRGTTRVESGDSKTITITPTDPQLTLILDNGVDVSSQLVAHGGTIENPVVSTAQGASYGFVYSSSTGYYISNNKGVDKSAAVCRIDFDLPVRCLVTINYINYAEATYDFGVFGNIDSPLSNNYYAAGSNGATITDNDYKLACNTSTYNNSSVQTITYEIPSGEHFINIKFSKDDATSSNNDTLQWKIASIEPLETNNYYTYTLNNINQDHSLVFIFGNVTYYFVTSSSNGNGKINPSGQMVVLPGDNYRLTIVPENIDDVVSITDNNIDVTNSLVEKQETIEKDGSTYVVVNYIYTLQNIQTGHTLNVIVQKTNSLFLKQNSNWIKFTKVFVKENNIWSAVDDFESLFNDGIVYIKQ